MSLASFMALPIAFLASKMGFFSSVSALLLTLFRTLRKLFVTIDCARMNGDAFLKKEEAIEEPSREEEEEEEEEDEAIEEPSREESFVFTFKFQSFDEFRQTQEGQRDSTALKEERESPSSVVDEHDVESPTRSSFVVVEESESSGFVIAEPYSTPEEEEKDFRSGFLAEKDFREEISVSETNRDNIESEAAHSDSDSDSDSDSNSITSSREFSFMSPFVASTTEDFLSDGDFEAERTNRASVDSDFEEDDFAEKANEEQSSSSSSEESSFLESEWEHQELVEQIKMELKKVRATGLPTIMEESAECPRMSEDLKPWKIEEKGRRGERLSELHKFYKSYRERMRKFDILNYQKMYALGFLQSKDPLQSFSKRKSSTVWGLKSKKLETDQMASFARELQGDLEMVYVGQLCLSWEFLQWQYEKAFDIWESDPHGFRRYNEVAGEFQQFQVLLQRFVENEAFQGPRVENYVKLRCVMRNLLQVPVIREDSKEGNRARRGRGSGAITSDMLFDILEESIRTIWRFIKADKLTHTTAQKPRREKCLEFEDPSDTNLFVELQNDLQKKDKRLKEVLRSGNCILRRLKKKREEGSDHLHFFSQVDMRLVSRVLSMSKITSDQLVWCHSKLTRIHFVKRKIHVEPSFLLFPC